MIWVSDFGCEEPITRHTPLICLRPLPIAHYRLVEVFLARYSRTAPGDLTVLLSRDLGSSKLGLASRGLQLIHPDLRKRPSQRTDRAPVERFGPSSNCRASPAPIRVPALSLNKTTLRPEACAQKRRRADPETHFTRLRKADDWTTSLHRADSASMYSAQTDGSGTINPAALNSGMSQSQKHVRLSGTFPRL